MSKRNDRGFSLIELLMVVGIVMVMSAVAVPQIRSSLQRYQMESLARRVGSMILIAKREAARQNRRIPILFAFITDGTILWVDSNRDDDLDQGEQRIVFPKRDSTFATLFETVTLPDPDYGTIKPSISSFMMKPWGIHFSPEGTLIEKGFGATEWQLVTAMKMIEVKRDFGSRQIRFAVTMTPAGGVRLWTQETENGVVLRAWGPL